MCRMSGGGRFLPHALQHYGVLPSGRPERQDPTLNRHSTQMLQLSAVGYNPVIGKSTLVTRTCYEGEPNDKADGGYIASIISQG